MSDSIQDVSSNYARLHKFGEKSKSQETQLANILKVHRWNYTNNKVMWNTVSECLKDESLSKDMKAKVRSVLYAHDAEPCMNLSIRNMDLPLLGLNQMNPKRTDFLYEDQTKLKDSFGKALLQFCNKMHEMFEPVSSSENTGLVKWSLKDKLLLEYKNKLVQVQELYLKNLANHYNLLEEILQLRMNNLKEMSELKIKKCKLELEKYNLRSEMLTKRNRITVFTETSHTVDAYRTLTTDILKEQDECEEDLEKLRLLKEKYNQVACKEYDEILRDYISYKHDLQQRRLLFKRIKN